MRTGHQAPSSDIDVWELNEAFASQLVYCRDRLGIPMERINPARGSIAIGHPSGMTGSRYRRAMASTARPKGRPVATRRPSATKRAAATKQPAAKRAPAARAKATYVSKHPPKVRTAATLALIDRLREICLSLPDVTEQVAWGEPTWRAGKIFAMCDTYHHGSKHLSVHLAAPPGAQAALIDADPDRFFIPPYVGGKGWIGVVLHPDWDMVASLVATARELIAPAPRRLRRADASS